jgi:hypothetical protein
MVGYPNVGARRGEANGTMALLLAVTREVAGRRSAYAYDCPPCCERN